MISFIACGALLKVGLAQQDPSPGWSPLHLAVIQGDTKAVAALIAKGADVNARAKGRPSEFGEDLDRRVTPLHLAAETGRLEIAKLLVSAGARVDARDFDDQTALEISVQKPGDDLPLFLLGKGADPSAANFAGDTPLMLAKSAVVAEELIKRGARVNQRDKASRTAIHFTRSVPVAKILIRAGANIEVRDNAGQTPLLSALGNEPPDTPDGDRPNVAACLIEAGAKVNVSDSFGDTPLLLAAKGSYTQVVRLLLRRHADINVRDKDGNTPLFLAMENVTDPVVDKAIGHGYSAYANSRDPLQIIKLLLSDGASVDARNKKSQTPLIAACLGGDEAAIVELLLRHGASPNAKDSNGYSALHWAALNLHPADIRVLLAYGVDVNAKDKAGETALDLVLHDPPDAIGDRKGVIQLLKRARGE